MDTRVFWDRRWMVFVDGENFAIRAREIADKAGLKLTECRCYRKDVFFWRPALRPRQGDWLNNAELNIIPLAQRAYYYTSLIGDDDERLRLVDAIQGFGFHAEVYKRNRGQVKAKGVDIALTKDMLCHAFRNNYDVAVLVAGDGDYVPVVEEIKRMGKIVVVCFFSSSGLSDQLRRAADVYQDIEAWVKSASYELKAGS
jgi:NYN domain